MSAARIPLLLLALSLPATATWAFQTDSPTNAEQTVAPADVDPAGSESETERADPPAEPETSESAEESVAETAEEEGVAEDPGPSGATKKIDEFFGTWIVGSFEKLLFFDFGTKSMI